MNSVIKINDLMQKEVSRKEFLRYLGLALLAVIGITNLINNLQNTLSGERQKKLQSNGYGSSVYGR
ncbi:MAG: hypothetical protein V4702_01185 [Patescibacteria group bacterium]